MDKEQLLESSDVNPVSTLEMNVVHTRPSHKRCCTFCVLFICIILLCSCIFGIVYWIRIWSDKQLCTFSNKKKSTITIRAGKCNSDSLQQLEIVDLPSLESLIIEDNNFRTIRSLSIDGLEKLSVLTIGKVVFVGSTAEDSSLQIRNCPALQSVSIGAESFRNYGALELANLTKLESLSIGEVSSISGNFFQASLTLRDLPSLRVFSAGGMSFYNATSLTMESTQRVALPTRSSSARLDPSRRFLLRVFAVRSHAADSEE